MFSTLRIKNLGIIKEAEICLNGGLNIITGETGSGKSIFIKSILLLFGLVKGTELFGVHEGELLVEACFIINQNHQKKLKDLGFDFDEGELFIQRTLSASGKSRSILNGHSVPLSEVQKLAGILIEKHGQNSTQKLLKQENHLHILDSFAGESHLNLLNHYTHEYKRYFAKMNELEEIKSKAASIDNELEFLKFQLDEINAAELEEGEEEQLLDEKDSLQNSARINELLEEINKALGTAEDSGALDLMSSAATSLQSLCGISSSFNDSAELLNQSIIFLNEASNELNSLRPEGGNTVERLDAIEQRIYLISRLKKKHSTDIAGLLSNKNQLEKQLNQFENFELEIAERQEELRKLESKLSQKALELRSNRKSAANIFEESVTGQLKKLNMAEALFSVQIMELGSFNASGMDSVSFHIMTNRGTKVMPIEKIASGGELSRIALVVKTMLTVNSPKCSVFDEIDAGIGGKTADHVGQKLREAAKRQQTICVTHSPQIAAYADKHFLIDKLIDADSTEVRIVELEGRKRVDEIARMLSGKSTGISVQHASELLESIGV